MYPGSQWGGSHQIWIWVSEILQVSHISMLVTLLSRAADWLGKPSQIWAACDHALSVEGLMSLPALQGSCRAHSLHGLSPMFTKARICCFQCKQAVQLRQLSWTPSARDKPADGCLGYKRHFVDAAYGNTPAFVAPPGDELMMA